VASGRGTVVVAGRSTRSFERMRNVAIIVTCAVLCGCVESQFELAPESRLPAWFTLPSSVGRTDVSVTLTYYTTGPAKFELVDRSGRVLQTVEAQTCWHPDTLRKKNQYGGWDPDSSPHYVYFKWHGVLELVEHRPEPRFRISDDRKLRGIAAELPRCLSSGDSA
jgi:hypothetical protein